MVGERIRRLRRERNWSQKDLGNRAGIDQKSISLYESGQIRPKGETLQRLVAALEVPPEELMAEEPNVPSLAIDDPELLSIFREISKLPESDRERFKWMLSLAVRQLRIQEVMQTKPAS